MPKSNKSKNLEQKYQKKTQLEHIFDIPDTYIGSIDPNQTTIWVPVQNEITIDEVNNENSLVTKQVRMIKKDITYIPGLYKIFDEIIVNSFDQYSRISKERREGDKSLYPVKTIKVWVDEVEGSITVYNDGDGIDVAIHPTEKIYIPQMIFGELLTSTNYDKDEEKITGGKNGYGAKLTNIFSKFFSVETIDKKRKKRFYQEYTNNMKNKTKPEITTTRSKPYTKIKFIPDFEKFNCDGLSQDMILLIKKRTYDMAACSAGKLTIYLNDKKLDLDSFDKYISLYLGSSSEYPRVIEDVNDRWVVGATMNLEQIFEQVSFVNGISTIRGGRHVEYITRQITKKLAAYIKKKKKADVRESYIKENLMVFVNSIIVNPSFDSQTKETLTTTRTKFGSTCPISDSFIESLAKTGIMDKAIALDQFKSSMGLKRTDGKKTKNILDIPKLEDAKWAGTKKSELCTLILTEGDSAKAMAVAGISVLPDGRNTYGIFPLKGKLLNVRDKLDKDIVINQEITNIKRIFGLKEGKDYRNVDELRYGKLLIMTDQDVDGSHIKGLLINFLCRWPSLTKINGFITSLLTPIVKVKRNRTIRQFYTLTDYEAWKHSNNGGKGWTIKYYKGLGTSTPKEAKEYFREFKVVEYHWDDKSDDAMDLAFNKLRADDRKDWLRQYDRNVILNLNQKFATLTDFVNKDLIHFSMEDCERSIPNICDGFKPSQRKIYYCAEKRNLRKEIRVAQLAGYVSEHGAYHHGEASLQGAIVNMAQNYIGSNNINLLSPNGQFGSRLQGGKDSAQPRYIHTHLTNISSIVFNKLDAPMYEYVDDDGLMVEPHYYIPIIPMVLVNGTSGIGTGWSSNIPKFNPLDIVENIKRMINGQEPNELTPWYRGFTGSITKLGEKRWLSKGVYSFLDKSTIEITELPIGIWTNNYKTFLDNMLLDNSASLNRGTKPKKHVREKKEKKEKKNNKKGKKGKKDIEELPQFIKDYRNESSECKVKFIIKFNPNMMFRLLNGDIDKNGVNPIEKLLKLTSNISCERTLNLYDANLKIKHYDNCESILKDFFQIRKQHYVKRRKYLIDKLEEQLRLLSVRVKFILDVINEEILINNRTKSNVIEQLESKNYPKMLQSRLVELDALSKMSAVKRSDASYDFLVRMPIYNLTKEKIEELKQQRDDKSCELEVLINQTGTDLWSADLIDFENEYNTFMIEYYKYMGDDYTKKLGKRPRKIRKVVKINRNRSRNRNK